MRFSGKESTCQYSRHGFDPWVGEDPLEEGMATHSSILAGKIPRILPASQPLPLPRDSHVGLVVGPDLLDTDVILGVDEGLGGGIGFGHGHHAGDVLVVMLVFYFDLLGG